MLAAAALVAAADAVAAQVPAGATPATLDSAQVAWDEGRYVDALTMLERVLVQGGETYRRPIALLTGELYRTTAVAPDGRRAVWSADGAFVGVESGTPPYLADGRPATRPANAPAPRVAAFRLMGDSLVHVHDAPGYSVTFVGGRLAWLTADSLPQVVVRDLATGAERLWATDGLAVAAIADARDGQHLLAVARPTDQPRGRADFFLLDAAGTVTRLTENFVPKQLVAVAPGGRHIVYRIADRVAVLETATRVQHVVPGTTPAVSADGSTLVVVGRDGERNTIELLRIGRDTTTRVVLRSATRLAAPALAPDGGRIVYQAMPREDWELYAVDADGRNERRLTREIQHDVLPIFLDERRVLAMIGEPRHRRSYLYDVATLERTRLFHNNTVRTVAPEYAWAPSPDGTRIVIIADRDGDTVSRERGVYLVALGSEVTVERLLARVRDALSAERDLRQRGERTFAPIAAAARAAVADVAVARVDRCEADLSRFDSRYFTQPGNQRAMAYFVAQLQAMGYEPELQWFEARGTRTANIIATLRGTANPDLVYVVSSHFDSVEGGPGADDNGSGSCALLEAARALARRPQAATIQFAWFTGEEAGLLGSREYVRRAQQNGVRIAGALNNDMLGWRNDHRLDNTIRYSNSGLRDVQHAAAFLFTQLITYDSRYYQATDAQAYYDAYGDIVAGIGSYPILGNPHYHQSHDVYETVDARLIAEVAKTTVATLMLMASSPARLRDVHAVGAAAGAEVTWAAAPEQGVTAYRIVYGPPEAPVQRSLTVRVPRATLAGARAGWHVAVKAVGPRGLESWDWARAVVVGER